MKFGAIDLTITYLNPPTFNTFFKQKLRLKYKLKVAY